MHCCVGCCAVVVLVLVLLVVDWCMSVLSVTAGSGLEPMLARIK